MEIDDIQKTNDGRFEVNFANEDTSTALKITLSRRDMLTIFQYASDHIIDRSNRPAKKPGEGVTGNYGD